MLVSLILITVLMGVLIIGVCMVAITRPIKTSDPPFLNDKASANAMLTNPWIQSTFVAIMENNNGPFANPVNESYAACGEDSAIKLRSAAGQLLPKSA